MITTHRRQRRRAQGRRGAARRRSSSASPTGFGGNSWRLVTTASARDEAQKCSSVSSIDYADGQGNTQKAISDIQGMVAKGVDALVVFPDAGKAMLPALRSSYKAGVVTVPYRVTPWWTGRPRLQRVHRHAVCVCRTQLG
jgi:hypothetical protein